MVTLLLQRKVSAIGASGKRRSLMALVRGPAMSPSDAGGRAILGRAGAGDQCNEVIGLIDPLMNGFASHGAAVTTDDSQAVRAFVSQLPLTLTLKDHAATEKIADLPKKLPTAM
jgi:hypothetical protein